MVYEVRVQPVGADPKEWYVYVPAFGVGRFVSDESRIPEVAHAMIAERDAAPSKFDIDLELGRVVRLRAERARASGDRASGSGSILPTQCAGGSRTPRCAMADNRPHAIGLVRLDLVVPDVNLYELVEKHGYRLVFTIKTDTGPAITTLALAQQAVEHCAEAVVVPGFEHAESVRCLATDIGALVTPMQIYPPGYRWPVEDSHREQAR